MFFLPPSSLSSSFFYRLFCLFFSPPRKKRLLLQAFNQIFVSWDFLCFRSNIYFLVGVDEMFFFALGSLSLRSSWWDDCWLRWNPYNACLSPRLSQTCRHTNHFCQSYFPDQPCHCHLYHCLYCHLWLSCHLCYFAYQVMLLYSCNCSCHPCFLIIRFHYYDSSRRHGRFRSR